MKMKFIIFFLFLFNTDIFLFAKIKLSRSKQDNRPVIGILASPAPSNPPPGSDDEKNGTEQIAQIDLNYIQWLQLSGARVIPILPWFTKAELDEKLLTINGVVFQGGSMKYNDKKDYSATATSILDYAEKNQNFVVWGICNGFQLINHWGFDRTNKNNPVKANQPPMETLLLSLQPNPSYKSKILAALSKNDYENITKNPTTAHFHSFSVQKDVSENNDYNQKLNVAAYATNPGSDTDVFVNIVEGKNSKIYGTQFHPEKMLNSFYKKTKSDPDGVLDDGKDGVFFDQGTSISKSLGKFLVQEANNGKIATDDQIKKFNPLPDIVSILDGQIENIRNNKKAGQINTNGIAVLSCGRFSYSWYSKIEKDASQFKFTCIKNSGQA